MNIDEMFQWGVTPKEGEYAGKRFKAETITPTGVVTKEWETGKFGPTLLHGDYKIWAPNKTIFNTPGKTVTWDKLKRAFAENSLPDSTPFFVKSVFWGSIYAAHVKLIEVDGQPSILVY